MYIILDNFVEDTREAYQGYIDLVRHIKPLKNKNIKEKQLILLLSRLQTPKLILLNHETWWKLISLVAKVNKGDREQVTRKRKLFFTTTKQNLDTVNHSSEPTLTLASNTCTVLSK